MHEILKDRVWRKLEALPQEQVYQVLDYMEFLEAKYAKERAAQPDALQKFAERVEDSLRMRSVGPKVISGTVGLLGTAHKVMRTVSDVGRGVLGETPPTGSRPPAARPPAASPPAAQPVPPRPATPSDVRTQTSGDQDGTQ